jgi:6-pyruvoyltetrahydropterin/6-carboxytetrahydropterin synthase
VDSSDPSNNNPLEQLELKLTECLAPLDYDLLNHHLDNPGDENLAAWVRDNIQLPRTELVGIRSTAHQGSDIEAPGITHIWRRYRFEAAHQLPNVPPGHQCGRMHGHGFEVILHVEIENTSPDAIDYATLDQHWQPIHDKLHHHCLNDIPGLENPTSESLCGWIWQRLKPQLPQLSWVTVYETVTAGCHYDGRHYRIWKEQRFESALSLPNLPGDHPARRLHGHSYLVRLHLTAPLDPVMCWTIDYGDVKQIFKPAYQQLDHHRLNDIPDLDNPTPAAVADWIRQQVSSQLPELDRVDLYHKPGCGVILNWGEHEPALPS